MQQDESAQPTEVVAEDAAQQEAVQQEAVTQDDAQEIAARPEELRILEALLFASTEPLDQSALAKRMPEGVNVKKALEALQADYAMRGINLVRIANKWTFRTAGDLAWLMTREVSETKKLSRAAVEVLAIVAYHQPVTRAEIEDIRGVVTSKGTLDVLLETGWIKPRGRRKTPGRPLTFGTTDTFLSQFGLEALGDLPGLEELKGTGLLDSRLPAGFSVPNPSDDPQLREDEDPLEDGELHLTLSEPDPEFPEAQAEQAETAAGEEATAEAVGFAELPATEVGEVVEAEESEAPALGAVDIDEEDAGRDEAETEQGEVELAEAEAAELDADEQDDDFEDEDDDLEDDEEIDADEADEEASDDDAPKPDRDDGQHH
ncbi:MAG: SMC-Scp complex subunit ScpB [Bradyrhizobiaceae bacterium PARB1]|nr:MAG: SMC-Scp complex subunit ScpB [Bradyrhizobiaceae bacterium PARB1]